MNVGDGHLGVNYTIQKILVKKKKKDSLLSIDRDEARALKSFKKIGWEELGDHLEKSFS